MAKSDIVVNAIPSSFVFNDMKLLNDKGAGEAKLFVKSKAKEAELDAFFQFGSGIKYRFDKKNMLEYLLQVKMEFVFQTINHYKAANAEKWNEMYSEVKRLSEQDFIIHLEKFTNNSRYYIRADEDIFRKLFRKMVVPKLTDLQLVKDDELNEIVLYLNVNYGYKRTQVDVEDELEEDNSELKFKTGVDILQERNRIVFGAPGTGKSFRLKIDCEKAESDFNAEYERVTFHPDYTYSQFVGTYKPVMDDDREKIKYEYVPGPFMRILAEALKSALTLNPKPYLLIIEEINRAKVAAVFGEVFQLLDRDDDGISEYEIHASEDIRRYLAKEVDINPSNFKKIRIPDNMYVWATMNSADQGVFPMDTAFKRRWNFEYLKIDQNEEQIQGIGKIMLPGSEEPIEWNMLRKAINDKMSSLEFKINEDKLMGPFFLSKKVIASNENGMIIDAKGFIEEFKSKVIMYLYEDAVKQGRHRFFDGCDSSKYSSVCNAFDTMGMGIFGAAFRETFYNKQG